MNVKLPINLFHGFAVVCVSGAVGMLLNIVLFFLAAFLFADTRIDLWVDWYFGNEEIIFVLVTLLFSIAAFPFVKRIKKVI
jgi:F0F1-type ATP synthase assembly protein I